MRQFLAREGFAFELVVAATGRHQQIEEILAAQVIVACAGMHLDDTVEYLENRNVEGSAAQVQDDECRAVDPLLQPVSDSRRRGFIDQALNADSRQFAGRAGRLALRIAEVGRHADDGLGDVLAELVARIVQQRTQH